MRWDEIEENNLVPLKTNDLVGGVTLDNTPGQQISGPFKDKMNSEEAKAYLDQHPDGGLHNPIFETDNFITTNYSDEYVFWDIHEQQCSKWDWSEIKEIFDPNNPNHLKWESEWWYESSSEKMGLVGGKDWWEEIKNSNP